MTNLVAIATTILATQTSEVKTNVTESPFSPDTPVYVMQSAFQAGPLQTKYQTTVVVKQDVLTFDWMGQTNVVIHSQVISSNTVHLRIKNQWEEIP